MSVSESVITKVIQRRGVRQFVKFCIVGGLSTVIDAGLHWLLMFKVSIGGQLVSASFGEFLYPTIHGGQSGTPDDYHDLSFFVFKGFTVLLAILNSYIWNRKWTFKVKGEEAVHKQVIKFYTVALIGWFLNVTISGTVNSRLEGHPMRSWFLGTLAATVIVVFWNFFGQKLWTFRKDMR